MRRDRKGKKIENKEFEKFLNSLSSFTEPSILTRIAFSLWDQRIERGELNEYEKKIFIIKRIEFFRGFQITH